MDELVLDLAPVGLQTQRAKAIHGLAAHLVHQHEGMVPSSLDELLEVPGLGEYSARAVLTFGFNSPVAVVDANVVRVLSRVFRCATPSGRTNKGWQEVADALLPEPNHREFNWAMLDLGALVCRYVEPRCGECPLAGICDYKEQMQRPPGIGEERRSYGASALRVQRRAKGWSLVRLAQSAGVSKLTIVNIEAGRVTPRPVTLEKLAKALGVDPEAITPSH